MGSRVDNQNRKQEDASFRIKQEIITLNSDKALCLIPVELMLLSFTTMFVT